MSTQTQKEQAIDAIRNLIVEPRSPSFLRDLGEVLDEARNGPPDGAADGSLSQEAWVACCDLYDALKEAQDAFDTAANLLRTPTPAPF